MRTSRRDRALLSFSGMLVRLACHRLPASTRDEWICEWTNELPAILADTEIRSWLARAASTVLFAVDQQRSTLELVGTTWWRVLGKRAAVAIGMAVFAVSVMSGSAVGKYITSHGDSGQVSKTKNNIIYSICSSAIAYPLVGLLFGPGVMASLAGVALALNVVTPAGFIAKNYITARWTQARQQDWINWISR